MMEKFYLLAIDAVYKVKCFKASTPYWNVLEEELTTLELAYEAGNISHFTQAAIELNRSLLIVSAKIDRRRTVQA